METQFLAVNKLHYSCNWSRQTKFPSKEADNVLSKTKNWAETRLLNRTKTLKRSTKNVHEGKTIEFFKNFPADKIIVKYQLAFIIVSSPTLLRLKILINLSFHQVIWETLFFYLNFSFSYVVLFAKYIIHCATEKLYFNPQLIYLLLFFPHRDWQATPFTYPHSTAKEASTPFFKAISHLNVVSSNCPKTVHS